VTHPHERRRVARWRAPVLTVVIGGQTYASADWSLAGVLIAGVGDRGWIQGQALDAALGLSVERLFETPLEVVCYRPAHALLGARCRQLASTLLEIKRACERVGIRLR
jgi:hypothetical protein